MNEAAFTLGEVLEAVRGVPLRGGGPFQGVSTDSRTIRAGELFVALAGERFDGAAFVGAAAARGAAGAVVDRGARDRLGPVPDGFALIAVPDTLRALGDLAAAHRRRQLVPLVAVTGSNGKTTTKELCAAALATRGPVLKTEGNLNNLVGLPLMLLRLESAHCAAVLEMGMNHFGEIARLAEIAAPEVGLVTNAHGVHTAHLGSVEGVARAKGELYQGLPPGGIAVVNADDDRMMDQARTSGRATVTFGQAAAADVRLVAVDEEDHQGLRFRIAWRGREHTLRLAFAGRHNALNACGAFAAGAALGLQPEAMAEALAGARPPGRRMRLVRAPEGWTVLDDCYNANPVSMRAALATLSSLARGGRTVAVLGDMLELGPEEDALHRAVGEEAGRHARLLLAFGPRSRLTADAARAALGAEAVAHFEELAPALEWLKARLAPGDLVLVKGSRGMRMERFSDALGAALPEGDHP